MKTNLANRRCVAAALVAGTMVLSASAQESQSNAPLSSTPTAVDANGSGSLVPAGPQSQAAEPGDNSAATFSAGIKEILKLADAGVSNDILRTFIQTSPVAYNPTAADILSLKAHGVPDDITTALMKRGAELRAQAAPAVAKASAPAAPPRMAAPAYVYRQPGYAYLDPESYDYFEHYYLYPRTLAYVQQRLASYYPPFPYAYSRPMFFRPRFSDGFPPSPRMGFRGDFPR